MEKKTKVTALERQTAARVWTRPDTDNKVFDAVLCEAFAETLHEIWSKPWLGNATTGELIDELRARSNLSYKTYDPEPVSPPCDGFNTAANPAGCRVPPAGWRCSREPNHDGPCAARPGAWADQPTIDNAHVEGGCEQFSPT